MSIISNRAARPATHRPDIPVYSAIRRELAREIASRKPGDVLDSEERLATRFQVNRHTVRKALDGLVNSGLIERKRGVGSVVLRNDSGPEAAPTPLAYFLGDRCCFSRVVEDSGHRANVILLGKSTRRADAEVSRHLSVRSESRVILIETLRCVDDQPFCVTSHWLPAEDAGSLLESYGGGSLHQHIEATLGWSLYRAVSVATACMPEIGDSELLGIAPSQPVLQVKSVNLRARDGTPVEFARTLFRSDRAELHLAF